MSSIFHKALSDRLHPSSTLSSSMEKKQLTIAGMPLDILVLVISHLDPKSFESLCSTCWSFHHLRLDPTYWSHATRTTFRVPNQPPVVQHDGIRWRKMYYRLLKQSRVFTWGATDKNRLGHSYHPSTRHRSSAFPTEMETEMEGAKDLGIIADMQCGGWSTTLLTSRGILYTAGVLDGQRLGLRPKEATLGALEFPPGYPSPDTVTYQEPATAICQFSAGRSHILALSDSGKIWSWYNTKKPAVQIKFGSIELKDTLSSTRFGQVRQVTAGWSRSSAYVYGAGIVVWSTIQQADIVNGEDTMLVLDTVEIPRTRYYRTKNGKESEQEGALDEEIGVVLNYIILEHFVVFVTDIGKVFCAKFGGGNRVDQILELRALRNESGTPSDVQGSFRRFAIFKNGEVITAHQSYLEACWNNRGVDTEPTDDTDLNKIPALQHKDVISVAFGDYHFLALHSNGKITSYGIELQNSGALGLGPVNSEGLLRGIAHQGRMDGQLLPHAYIHGRQVWFEKAKKQWLSDIMKDGKTSDEAKERMHMCSSDRNVQGEVSEWFEQEGRALEAANDRGEDGLGAYFALRVSAAGWHSGALVLVNDKVDTVTNPWPKSSFPRLRLGDGREMPGSKEFDEWREERPEWLQHDMQW